MSLYNFPMFKEVMKELNFEIHNEGNGQSICSDTGNKIISIKQ